MYSITVKTVVMCLNCNGEVPELTAYIIDVSHNFIHYLECNFRITP